MSRTSRPVDLSLRHGYAAGTANATATVLSSTLIADLAGLDPLWAAGAGGAGAVAAIAAGRASGLSARSLLYRAACFAGAGGWSTHALATSPWSLDALASLGVGGLAAGLLAPAFATYERVRAERRARLMLATSRTRVATDWEERIHRVCHVKVRIANVEDWPTQVAGTTAGITLDAELPAGGATWETLAGHADALASDAKLPNGCGVEVTAGAHRGAALLRVALADALAQEIPFPADYSPLTINNTFPVGTFRDATLAHVTLRWLCGLLVGRTGTGKTNLMQVVNLQLARCTDVLIRHIDLNGGGMSLPWLRHWAESGFQGNPVIDWVADTADEAEKMVADSIAEIKSRKVNYRERMRAANDDKIPVGPDVPAVVIVVDEYAEVPQRVRDGLETINNTGRAAGYRVLFCGVRATAAVIETNIVKQIGVRISMRTADRDELAYVFDWKAKLDPQDIPHDGCGFLQVDLARPRPFRAYRLAPTQIEQAAAAVAPLRPALDAPTAAATRWYATRWDRAGHLFTPVPSGPAQTGFAYPVTDADQEPPMPSPDNPDDPFRDTGGTLADALDRLDQARRNARRTPGGDPDIDDEFHRLVRDLEIPSDPTTWKNPTDRQADRESTPASPETGWAAPAGNPIRVRALELLRLAGPTGALPGAIHRKLADEGLKTSRQTITEWFAEEMTGSHPAVVQPGGPRTNYIHRDTLPDNPQ